MSTMAFLGTNPAYFREARFWTTSGMANDTASDTSSGFECFASTE